MKEHREFPSNSVKISLKEIDSVIYLASNLKGFWAVGFTGKRIKPSFRRVFQSKSERQEFLVDWVSHQAKANGKDNESEHPLKTGDILYTVWGYEQTNACFYEVVKTTRKSVHLIELKTQTKETFFDKDGVQCSTMSGHATPIRGEYSGESFQKRVVDEGLCKINESIGYASIWDGEPVRCSWYG